MKDPQLRSQIKILCFSVGVTLLISIIFALAIGLILSNTLMGIGVFLLVTVCQFLFSYISSIYRSQKLNNIADNMINNIISSTKELRIPIELSCAYCNIQNNVPMSLSEDNTFVCKSCNQPNNVYIQFTTVRITRPLSEKIDVKEVDFEDKQRQTTINEPIEIS